MKNYKYHYVYRITNIITQMYNRANQISKGFMYDSTGVKLSDAHKHIN